MRIKQFESNSKVNVFIFGFQILGLTGKFGTKIFLRELSHCWKKKYCLDVQNFTLTGKNTMSKKFKSFLEISFSFSLWFGDSNLILLRNDLSAQLQKILLRRSHAVVLKQFVQIFGSANIEGQWLERMCLQGRLIAEVLKIFFLTEKSFEKTFLGAFKIEVHL